MTISFSQIPSTIRVPGQYLEIDNTHAIGSTPAQYKRILVIGQMLATGTGPALTPTLIASNAQVQGYTGLGSMLANMVAALRVANAYTEAWFSGVADNGAGVKAPQTVTVTGPATGAGTLNLFVGGKLVQCAVAQGVLATSIATNVADAVNAYAGLDMSATVSGAVVTLTAKHKGVAGNYIDVRTNYYSGDALPNGIGITIAAGTVGTANPDITAAIAAIGEKWFTHIVMPYTDSSNLNTLATYLESQWSALVQKPAVAFAAASGSLSTLQTLGTGRNNETISIIDASTSPTPPWIWAAELTGVDAFEPIPNRPRQTLVLPGVLAPDVANQRTQSEQNTLLYSGIATHMVDKGGNVMIQRLITTYQVNGFGVPDASYLDVETIELLAYLRWSRQLRIATQFPRNRLAVNGSHYSAGSDIITPDDIRDSAYAQALEWIEAGYMDDNMPLFIANYAVEISPSDPNRINEVIAPELVGGLRVFAGKISFMQQ